MALSAVFFLRHPPFCDEKDFRKGVRSEIAQRPTPQRDRQGALSFLNPRQARFTSGLTGLEDQGVEVPWLAEGRGVFLGFSMVFLGFSMVCLGFSMVCLGFSMVFLEKTSENSTYVFFAGATSAKSY